MKREIVIWGTGQRAEETYTFLRDNPLFQVVAFGENNSKLWGSKKYNLPVISLEEVKKLQNISDIVIASSAYEEIRKQLEREIGIPVYNKIDDLIYTRIAIDISGCCNAKCAWCVTGRKNREQAVDVNSYMNYEEFTKLYNHMISSGMIIKNTEIMLYSWGEPFLNKDYLKIIDYLSEEQQKFSVSTNASVIKLTNNDFSYKNCCTFVVSMPGFSQESYDKIHGFCFERMKQNIVRLVNNVRSAGFGGDLLLSYHVYKFNRHEINAAKRFAEDLGMRFNPYYPYFNGNSMTEAYLENRLSTSMLEEAKEHLFLDHVKDLISRRPDNYRCFLENIISIDYKGRLVLCCASDPQVSDYYWGSIMEIHSLKELQEKRRQMLKCSSCNKCRKLGIDYWMERNPAFEIE